MDVREEMRDFHVQSDSPHLYGIQLRGNIVVLWRLILMMFFSDSIITLTEQSEEWLIQQFMLSTL